MNPSSPASDVLAWRGELAITAFEGAFSQIRAVARFIELGEYELSIRALERAMPFWASAIEEMRAIRSATRGDPFTAEVAVEYRRQHGSAA